MAIDWAQVLEKPDKAFKVPGTLLLQQRNKIEKLQKSLDELKAGREEADQNVASLNLRIETVLGDLEAKKNKISEQEEQIDKLKEVLAGLEDNLASHSGEKEQLSNRVTELEGAVSAKDAELSDLEGKLAVLEEAGTKAQELQGKLGEMSDLQGKLSESEAQIGTLQAKIAELEGTLGNFDGATQKKFELMEQEKNSFEEQYKIKEAELTEKEEIIKAMEGKIGELRHNLSAFAPPEPAKMEGGGAASKSGIQSQIPWKSGTGVHVCPDCGSNRTGDIQDKTKVLYVAAGTPIYAKKKRCLNCGAEWAID